MFQRTVVIVAVLFWLGQMNAQTPPRSNPGKPGDPPIPGPDPEAMVKSILARMDKNMDGKISKSEAEGRIADNFDRIDLNKDGFLDRTELLAMAKQVIARQAMGGGMPGGRPMFGPGAVNPNDFDALDKNADGRLTRDELKGTRFAELFDQIDTDKNGKIDPKEWAAFHAKKR